MRKKRNPSDARSAFRKRSLVTIRKSLPHVQFSLGVLVVVAPQMLGGVYVWATLGLAMIGCLLILGLLWEVRDVDDAKLGTDGFVGVFALLLVATVLQAVPLPASVMAFISPDAVANSAATARGLGLNPPGWVAYSLDPGATHERILFSVAVLAAFCSARVLATLSRATRILMTVAGSVVLVALVTLGHRLFELSAVFDVYVPSSGKAIGPLLNPNNLAGFMALGLPICLGFAVKAERGPRWAWSMGAALVAATGLLAGSRGGTVVLLGGALLYVLLLRIWGPGKARRRKREVTESEAATSSVHWVPNRAGFMVGAIVLLGVGLAVLAADDFMDTTYQDLSKLDLFRAELTTLAAHPIRVLLGVGRGAFATGMAQMDTGTGRPLYAECLPLQLAIEFGVPLALVLVVFGTAFFWRGFWRWRSPVQLGGLVGLLSLGLQNLVDYSLELSGIAVPAAVALAASLPRAAAGSQLWNRWFGLRRAALFTVATGVVLIAAVGPSTFFTDSLRAQRRLQEDLAARTWDTFWTRFDAVAPAHPGDPAFAALAAAESVLENRPSAPFWLNRTMELAPGWPAPHLWAAHWLATRGRLNQALDEMRLAAGVSPWEARQMLCDWLPTRPIADTVLRVAPDAGSSRRILLNGGAECLGSDAVQAAKVDDVLLREEPQHPAANARRARRSLAAREYALAFAQAKALQRIAPELSEGYEVEAEAQIALKHPELAVRILRDAVTRVSDRRSALSALAVAQTRAGDATGMRATIDRLRMEAGGDVAKLAATMALLGRCEGEMGNDARALKAMREAHWIGGGPANLAAAAEIATRLGQLDFALGAWQQLCDQQPSQRAYCEARDALMRRTNGP